MISRQTYFYLPILIFGGVWSVVLIMFQLSSLGLYHISFETVILLFSSIFMVFMGYFLYRFYFMGKTIYFYIESNNQEIRINYRYLSYLLLLVNILLVISLIVFTIVVAQERGGIIDYLANPVLSRRLITELGRQGKWDIKFSLATYGTNIIIISLLLGGILFTSKKLSHQLVAFSSPFLGIIYGIITFSRYALVYSLVFWLLSTLFVSFFLNSKERKRVTKLIGYIFILFTLIFLLLSYLIINLRLFVASQRDIQKIFFQQLNYYIIGNVVGFDQFLRHGLNLEWGASIFRSIYKWLVRFGIWDDLKIIETNYNFVFISSKIQTNTYSYLRVLYEDFGVTGLMSFSLAWGVISAKIADYFLRQFTLLRLYLIVLTSFAFFISFFGFYLVALSKIFLDIVLIFIIQIFFKGKLILETNKGDHLIISKQ